MAQPFEIVALLDIDRMYCSNTPVLRGEPGDLARSFAVDVDQGESDPDLNIAAYQFP